MKRNIVPNDCKTMFSDKLDTLSMKELGIELKHFSIGTAPERPSFLVNQDNLKKMLTDRFYNFFDTSRSQGLEIVFLKSNYGNGKSHFIRTIHSFLSNFENVLSKKVSLKQEKTDLKIKILEGVGQKTIKDCAAFWINAASEKSLGDEREALLLTLSEELHIDSVLSDLLYHAARSEDISKQAQAIAILKGNYLPTYLKAFHLKREELNHEFYFNMIRLICDYLYKNQCYLVIFFDEYEHVYSWKDAQARKVFFEDIKLFTDNMDTYKNLFFVFAESESADNELETSDDPAYVSRKRGRTYQIESISSELEVDRLFQMIKSRYEKYYTVSFDGHTKDILEAVKQDPQVKTNSSYRDYTQVIMRVLDQYRNSPPKSKKSKTPVSKTSTEINTDSRKAAADWRNLRQRWESASSISKKTLLCEALEYILGHSTEKIIGKSKKRGVYQTINGQEKIEYRVVATDKPSSLDFIKRYNDALRTKEENGITKCIIIYPRHYGSMSIFEYDNVIFYNGNTVPAQLKQIYENQDEIVDVFSYLKALEAGC